jgi:hypothetical protein
LLLSAGGKSSPLRTDLSGEVLIQKGPTSLVIPATERLPEAAW